jgi:hypothetical protein
MIVPEGAESAFAQKAPVQDFPGPKPEIDPALITQTAQTDVLVLGGGHAGLQCALAAAEGGVDVAVLESRRADKMTWLGEQIGTFNSQFLTKLGFGNYDLDEIIDEFDHCAGFQNNHEIIAKYVRSSGETLDHFLSLIPEDSDILDPDQYNIHQAYGNPTYPIHRGGYRTWASTIQFRGKLLDTRDVDYPVGICSRLKDICKIAQQKTVELGAKWYFGYRVCVLTQDETGRVTGAIAKDAEGNYLRILARRGVVNCLGNYGDLGMKLGVWAGGHLDNTPLKPVPMRIPGDAARAFGQTSFLLLNAKGKRFVNESVPYAMTPAMERQAGSFVTMVTDRKWLQQVRLSPVHHGCPDFGRPEYIEQCAEDMSHVLEHGADGYGVRSCSFSEREQMVVYAANTLEELADYLGYTGTAKEQWLVSIQRYNEMCYQKHDTDFNKDVETLLPVDEAPFYGCITQLEPRDWSHRSLTMNNLGGLHTDENLQVLDNDLEPIPGLFAAGNTMGYRYSVFYPTPCGGNFIGSAMTLGRWIGKYLSTNES